MRGGGRAAYRRHMAADQPTARRSPWRTALIVLAVVVVAGMALIGLSAAAYVVLLVVAMGSFGSNK
jgi:LPS O-antigen subunit length determinant protein (WzzB/FepE family)